MVCYVCCKFGITCPNLTHSIKINSCTSYLISGYDATTNLLEGLIVCIRSYTTHQSFHIRSRPLLRLAPPCHPATDTQPLPTRTLPAPPRATPHAYKRACSGHRSDHRSKIHETLSLGAIMANSRIWVWVVSGHINAPYRF